MTPPADFTDPYPDSDAEDVEGLDERSFEELEDEVDRLAAQGRSAAPASAPGVDEPSAPLRSEADFEAAVRVAVEALPDQFRAAIRDVVVVVSDEGASRNAYGMYVGRTAGLSSAIIGFPTSSVLPDEIIIFRDTLIRDFGHEPLQLRAQIVRTVRHEIAHHFGFEEPEVQGLGL